VWDLVSPVIVESYVETGDTEELIVRPLSPEVLPSQTIMFVDGDRVLPGVVAEGTCYVKTTSMRVGVFPAELYFGFEDKRLIGRYSLYINGKRRKHNERAIGTIQKVRVRDESDVVFEMTDTSLETKCYVRVRVSE
jgi:membrane protease subunit (stomatin/prohibitin family)